MSLQTHNLTKIYQYGHEKQILFENLNIIFPEFGMIAIIGESGCGKTTLLQILSGIEKDYEGHVSINHHDIKKIKDYNRNFIAMVYQNYHLFDYLDVYDNCIIYNKMKGIPYQKKEVIHLLKKFDLEKEIHKKVKHLSGGQKQRVALIRAFMTKCPIILCDEPTGSLNEENRVKIYQYLQSYCKNHLIVIVSHDLEIKKYCQNVIDFHCLKHHYDFSCTLYQRYSLTSSKKMFFLLKENIYMLMEHKLKLMMIFLSQIFIVLAVTFFITGIHGLEIYYANMKDNTINHDLITIKKSNSSPFLESEIKKLKGSYYYILDIGKIKNVDYFQSYPIKKDLKKNEVIINESLYKHIKSKKLIYYLNNISFHLKVKQIIYDEKKDPILYYDYRTLNEKIKLLTIDLSTCFVYIDDYHHVKSYIHELKFPYEGYSLVEEEFDAYYHLLKLCQSVGVVFIILSILIAIVLMFFIILSMFYEMKKDDAVFLSNGMNQRLYHFFIFEKVEIICLFIFILSSFFCYFSLMIVNALDISKMIFHISKIFMYPILFYSQYDLYIIYFLFYFCIGIILFILLKRHLKRMNLIEVLRED